MKILLISSVFLVVFSQASSYQVLNIPQKLHISFYITSKCKDTINFITTQLYPTYQQFKDYLDVEFIPWGKTKRLEDGSISCQFGIEDCIANRIQSCVLHILEGFPDKIVEYMNCEFKTLSSASGNLHCVNQVGISDYSVSQCTQSILADQLQQNAELKTSRIGITFVPTIVFQSTFDQNIQDAAFRDFRGTVCHFLQNIQPGICGRSYGYNDVIE